MIGRRDSVLAVGGMGFAAFVLSHDILYLATYGAGFRAAMARTGHGELWVVTVFSSVAISLAIVALAGWRLWVLWRLAPVHSGPGSGGGRARWSELLRVAARLWLVIAVLAMGLFVASENWERHVVGLPLPGLAVLGFPASPGVLGIFASVAGLLAAVATLYFWRHQVLAARVAARARLQRPPAKQAPGLREPVRPPAAPLARRTGGRAPPRAGLRGARLPAR